MTTEKLGEGVSYRLEGIAFGLADGLIMSLGLIIGIAEATSDTRLVIVAGIIGGFANAFGNSIGFFMSQSAERGLQIYETTERGVSTRVHPKKEVYVNSVFSFISTIAVSIVLLFPFILFNMTTASIIAFMLGVIVAFVLGNYVGKISRENPYICGLKYAVLAVLGAIIAHLIADLLTVF